MRNVRAGHVAGCLDHDSHRQSIVVLRATLTSWRRLDIRLIARLGLVLREGSNGKSSSEGRRADADSVSGGVGWRIRVGEAGDRSPMGGEYSAGAGGSVED